MKIRNLIIFLIFTIIYLFLSSSVNAQGYSLSVYPPITQITANPPAEIKSPILIANDRDESVILKIKIVPFKDSGTEEGLPIFEEDKFNDYPILKRVKIFEEDLEKEEIELGPKQEKALELRINIEEKDSFGDYYFSIIFLTQSEETEDTVSVNSAGIASNVLLTVGTQEKADAFLREFSTSFFKEQGPVPFKVRIENLGKQFITPTGTIMIKNMYGQTIGKVELLPVNILSNTVRAIPDKEIISKEKRENYQDNKNNVYAIWNEKILFGLYTAELNLDLSEDGPNFKKRIYFFAFPIQALIGLFLAIIIAVIIFQRVRKRLKV